MKSIFRTVFYLRSNYINKEGKTPVMLRIYLNNERLCIGSAGVAVEQNQWDSTRERVKGRNTEALSMNLQLDSIQNDLQTIYRKLEKTDDLCLERIKSEYLGMYVVKQKCTTANIVIYSEISLFYYQKFFC